MLRPESFVRAVTHVQSPAVEQMLKDAATASTIPFAGGLPAAEFFPANELTAALNEVMADAASTALQYTWPEGNEELRNWLAERLRGRGIHVGTEHILVTHGAQQALDLVAKLLVRPGATVALEAPTFPPAIQAFELHHAQFATIPRTTTGLDMEMLEHALGQRPSLAYLVPAGHNPTGGTLRADEIAAIRALSARHRVPVLEDTAYAEIQFNQPAAYIKQHADDEALLVGTFSKILSPGLRIGYVVASTAVVRELTLLKQAADLQSATLNQLALARYLRQGKINAHIAASVTGYRERRDVLVNALRDHAPVDLLWHIPSGGFSIWAELPETHNTEALLRRALAHGVAFEPGRPYFPGKPRDHCLRLSFASLAPDVIRDGMQLLGPVLREDCSKADS